MSDKTWESCRIVCIPINCITPHLYADIYILIVGFLKQAWLGQFLSIVLWSLFERIQGVMKVLGIVFIGMRVTITQGHCNNLNYTHKQLLAHVGLIELGITY